MKGIARLAVTLLPIIGLTGCATTYKPAGLSEQQITQKINDLRQICQRFRQGDYVKIQFYDGAPGSTGTTVAGYFTAYNKMSGTLSLSAKYMEYSDRGTPYSLAYLSDVTPAQDPVVRVYQPNFIVRAIKSIFTIKDSDHEKAVLTE
jgi:hypothetical protein